MTKPDVILEVLQQMAVDATDATHLIERAYAAGLREGERKAAADLSLGLELARVDLVTERLGKLETRIDTLADTTNENLAIIAEALGSVLIDPDEGLSEQEAVEFIQTLQDDNELHSFVDHCRKQHEQGQR